VRVDYSFLSALTQQRNKQLHRAGMCFIIYNTRAIEKLGLAESFIFTISNYSHIAFKVSTKWLIFQKLVHFNTLFFVAIKK